MNIIKATIDDTDAIEKLLYEVHDVHASSRPDLFKKGERKYSKNDVNEIIQNPDTPVYVYKENDIVVGYAFIIYLVPKANSLVDIKTMYVDDFCISKDKKHKGIGSKIFDDLKVIAKQNKCYNIILNVYNFNTPAYNFYKKQGMHELKTYMELVI